MKNNDKKRYIASPILCIIVAVLALATLTTSTLAAYKLDNTFEPLLSVAADFYFTSDLLTSGEKPQYNIAEFDPDSSRITFALRNYADEFNVSQTNVSYTVSATGVTSVNGTLNSVVDSAVVQAQNTVSLAVPSTAFTDGRAVIEVEATSTAPYASTLRATFVLHLKQSGVVHHVYDTAGSNSVTLTVTTGSVGGRIDFSTLPVGVIVNNTDALISVSEGKYGFTAAPYAQYTFEFFKITPATVYTDEQFVLSQPS